jgi:tRNA-specific 2-thiouridylase
MKKIFVALSGGVDSSVAALLLKRAGFSVVGVFMRLANNYQNNEKLARAAAKKLKIKFLVFDFRKEFKEKIINYFLKQTQLGLTPNPCVICNEEIKFGLFLDKALKMGADFVATGHYARLRREFLISNSKFLNTRLLKARDKAKDQSYFLWRLGQKQLSRILFPLGDYTKPQVREIARKAGLPTATTKDSQNLCFLAGDTTDFLKSYLKNKPGAIVDDGNKIIGRHQGLGFYTLGQRAGIGEALFQKYQSQGPYYVLRKDLKKNQLVITREPNDLLGREFLAGDLHWVSGQAPKMPFRAKVKIRSRQNEVLATIRRGKKQGQVLVKLAKPQKAITPGQSAVFYRGEELLGGGIILASSV